ncbi:MAG: hypothetical protein H7A35_08015 [Planctomycetales bacterium]|nr:hypothetical protein [bacterium]UNM09999.1 MAG: hypothetical protein H7A35_08015 [Planctomycetales bacterium]
MAQNAMLLDSQFEQDFAVYEAWQEKWIRPVTKAVFNHSFGEAEHLLDAARTEIASGRLSSNLRAALVYPLELAYCRVYWHDVRGGFTQRQYEELIDRLSIPSQSSIAEYARRLHLVAIRCICSDKAYEQPSKAELEELLAPLPDKLSIRAWQEVALWAFRNNELEVLERAFEVFLINPPSLLGQARWQRVNLMYQLLSGKATRRDVYESLILLEIRPQLSEFRRNFWPKCVELGLVDNELEELLEQKSQQIMSGQSDPARERRTKSFLGT